jgi:hypothetical protein
MIILSRTYGKHHIYHGHFFGRNWPTGDDFWNRKLRGIPLLNAVKHFDKYFKKFNQDYFIIHEKWLLDERPDIYEFLKNRFVIINKPRVI